MPPRPAVNGLAIEINVTPMIDVMLVLLIIFMVVVPAIASPVALPVANQPEHRPEEPGDVVLSLDRMGAFTLEILSGYEGTPGHVAREVTADQLRDELTALYRERTRDRILYLKADSSLNFGIVERAMGIARRAGVRVVAAVTERRPQPGM